MDGTLDVRTMTVLQEVAQAVGLQRLSAASLDDPRFAAAADALDAYLDAGRHGGMAFLDRSRATRRDPARMLPGARSILVAVVPYGGQEGPIARYAQFLDYHTDLHQRLTHVADALTDRLPDVQTQVCVDTRPVMERAAATIAGVGSLGKNGCLIVPGLGSMVLIGCLLTTAKMVLAPSAEASDVFSVCGHCTACLEACPTDAFDAPGVVDSRRCISYLTIEHRGDITESLQDRMGVRVAGCDVCQEVCPHNQSELRLRRVVPAHQLRPPPDGPRTVDLAHLATLGSARYRAFVKHTALNRIPRRSLRRNALIALGNREGELSRDERRAVDVGVQDADRQVAAAARRALARRR